MTRHAASEGELIPAAWRRRAYPAALALIALAVAYGLVDGEQAAAWANLAAALVGAGAAALGTAYRPATTTNSGEGAE